ncbi:hypothetical protein LAUMK142_04988 [Mycobacterium pseudokansasii]|uniref:Uncharacterized protein n=1 Tax=Mycobacterium pseudokansasii TaxID=2341080 RepID=A0A498QY59_9MYCO|nr:hypothetical protein LAUMK142_04988 [Mycobacterium pseudokansasii]
MQALPAEEPGQLKAEPRPAITPGRALPAEESGKSDDAACEIGTGRRVMSHSPHLPQRARGICVVPRSRENSIVDQHRGHPRTPWPYFRHADTAPSLEPLVMAGVREIPHVLTESAAMPPYRVCGDGFDCACRAGPRTIGRPGDTVDAASAHSTPPAHTRRRQRTLDAISAHSTPSAHARRHQRTLDAISARSTPSAHARRRQRTLDAASRRPNRTSPRPPSLHAGV